MINRMNFIEINENDRERENKIKLFNFRNMSKQLYQRTKYVCRYKTFARNRNYHPTVDQNNLDIDRKSDDYQNILFITNIIINLIKRENIYDLLYPESIEIEEKERRISLSYYINKEVV